MALSGSLTTNAYGGVRSLTLSWSATQSIANNTSTITWTLSGSGSTANYNPYYYSGPFRVTIDGGQAYYSTTRIQLRSGTVVATGTKTVTHASDGTKSLTIKIEGGIYSTSINCTATQTFQLNTIPRQATLLDAPNFYDDENPTISFSNPAGSAITVQAYIEKTGAAGNIPVQGRTVTSSPYTFQLTSAERTVLQKLDTTSNTVQVRFALKSTIGNSVYYSTLDRTMTIRNPAPTLNPTVVDVGSVTTQYTGDPNRLILNGSTASVTFGAAAVKGASIVSRKVTCGSQTLTQDGSISRVPSGTFVFSVTDSRGNTTQKTVTKPTVAYVPLTCYIGQGVPDANGTFDFQVFGDYFNGSFGAVSNTLSVQYQYRQAGGTWTSWEAMTVSPRAGNYTATAEVTGLDYQKTYEFQAKAADKLLGAESGVKVVKSTPVFDWGENDFRVNVPLSCPELNWPGEGLGGRVMKLLWSGVWTSGSITVSDLPFYNLFAFGVTNNATATSSDETSALMICSRINETAITGGIVTTSATDTRLLSVNANISGTKLTLATSRYEIPGFTSSVNRPIYRIYGIL